MCTFYLVCVFLDYYKTTNFMNFNENMNFLSEKKFLGTKLKFSTSK